MLIVAHAGHWLVGVLQFIPVLAFIVWLVVTQARERRRREEEPVASVTDVPQEAGGSD